MGYEVTLQTRGRTTVYLCTQDCGENMSYTACHWACFTRRLGDYDYTAMSLTCIGLAELKQLLYLGGGMSCTDSNSSYSLRWSSLYFAALVTGIGRYWDIIQDRPFRRTSLHPTPSYARPTQHIKTPKPSLHRHLLHPRRQGPFWDGTRGHEGRWRLGRVSPPQSTMGLGSVASSPAGFFSVTERFWWKEKQYVCCNNIDNCNCRNNAGIVLNIFVVSIWGREFDLVTSPLNMAMK